MRAALLDTHRSWPGGRNCRANLGRRGTGKDRSDTVRVADQRKDAFLAILSQELGNPLATLYNTLLALQLTGGQDQSLPVDRALVQMSREVDYLNRIVDDLMDMSRIRQGQLHLQNQRVDLVKLVNDTVETVEAKSIYRGRIFTRSWPKTPVWVAGDSIGFIQVVLNLLTNAATYPPPGGPDCIKDRSGWLPGGDSGAG
ncbi:MAG: HAMP domain-containing histidine kinase [Cytophagaceae bacterium]|nr:MAG: HAMP domain-containing histidine kinase [Cytophagaceae bacterium]